MAEVIEIVKGESLKIFLSKSIYFKNIYKLLGFSVIFAKTFK